MPLVGDAFVQIAVNNRKFVTDLKTSENVFDNTADRIDRRSTGLGNTFTKLGRVLKGVFAAAVVTKGIQLLSRGLGSLVKNATDAEEQSAKLQAVLVATGHAAGFSADEMGRSVH